MDGTGPHRIKQNKPESEAPITYFLSNVDWKKNEKGHYMGKKEAERREGG